jgi:hypothetical protein
MKKLTGLAALLLAASMAACTSAETANTTSTTTNSGTASSSTAATPVSGNTTTTTTTSSSTSLTAADGTLLSGEEIFTSRDLEQSVDTTAATTYTVEDNTDIEITQEGTYILTGTASNVTVTINAADTDKVQLVLDGLNVSNDDAPVIYVLSADKVFITTTNSENTLTVTGTFQAIGDVDTDAVIYSKSDLTLNGVGTINIDSSNNGISSKDSLVITGGTYNITATEDAVEAHDSIAIADGTFTIDAGKDAFHSEDSDDDTVGYIYVSGGTFTIDAGDDGLQATTIAQFDGGSFTINAVEGIEGTSVQINGGTFVINASDDGINASQKSTSYDILIEINDGDITITMGSGDTDALDSNGSLTINGGTLNITAQSAFDYITTGQLNGGTVYVNGSQVTQMTTSMGGGGGGQMGGGQAGGQMGGGPGRG